MKNIVTAYILGARVIEKHFTLNKKLPGNDHYHSMDLNDLKVMCKKIKEANLIIGNKQRLFYLQKKF